MGNIFTSAATITLGVIGFVTALGVCLAYGRRSFTAERDRVRAATIDALRQAGEVAEDLCASRLGERDDWIGRLERHHADAHNRCHSAPRRDG